MIKINLISINFIERIRYFSIDDIYHNLKVDFYVLLHIILKTKKMKHLTILSLGVILLTSCPPSKFTPDSVNIRFEHYVDENTLLEDTLLYTNDASQLYSVQNLDYIITDINLTDEEGTVLQELTDIHYVTLSDPSSLNLSISSVLTRGEYKNIEFTFGLDSTKNISNLYVNEEFHTRMFWPDMMGGGYHYMKLEGRFDNDTTFYNTHTGGTMGVDYSFKKSFPINLTSIENGNIHIIDINMNINNWFSNPNTITLSTDGIMGNMQRQMELKQNGIEDVFW
jgi:hypothetical protein